MAGRFGTDSENRVLTTTLCSREVGMFGHCMNFIRAWLCHPASLVALSSVKHVSILNLECRLNHLGHECLLQFFIDMRRIKLNGSDVLRMRASALNNTSSVYRPPGTNRGYSYEPGNF
jgi:hypothetical protein